VRETAVRQQLEADLQKAQLHFKHGDLHDAERLLTQLARDDPEWIAPRQLLAEAFYRTGRFADCQSQLSWLAEHAVEHPRLSLISGALALARRDFTSALEELDYASHVEPELPSVQTLRGRALLRLGRLDDAEDSLQAALRQCPTDAIAFDGLAQIRHRLGEFEEAAKCALEALEHNMQLFTAHYHLGIALAKLDRPHEAIAALETAARIDANRAAPYYWLCRIAAEQLGDSSRASHYRDAGRRVIHRRHGRDS
jgi:predicted Zn-dependent protease